MRGGRAELSDVLYCLGHPGAQHPAPTNNIIHQTNLYFTRNGGTGQFLKRKGFKSEIFQEEIIQEEIIQVEIIQVGNDRSKKSYKWEMIEERKLTSRK